MLPDNVREASTGIRCGGSNGRHRREPKWDIRAGVGKAVSRSLICVAKHKPGINSVRRVYLNLSDGFVHIQLLQYLIEQGYGRSLTCYGRLGCLRLSRTKKLNLYLELMSRASH